MNFKRNSPINSLALACLALLFVGQSYANCKSVEFFVSNNTKKLNLKTAYKKLESSDQYHLQDLIIDVMQKNHVEQGKFENILGYYITLNEQNNTADNANIFITSPYQKLSSAKILNIAKQLANKLQQESVAVFIPINQKIVGDVRIHFISHPYTIAEVINLLWEKLPPPYHQAFSLHLNSPYTAYENAKVTEIEWLGIKSKPEEVKKAFPLEKVSYHYGKAFLVGAQGQLKKL